MLVDGDSEETEESRMTPEFWFKKPSDIFNWYLINPKHSKMRELRPIKRYVTCLRSHTAKWPGYGWPHLQYICPQIPSSVTVHHTQRCVSEAWVNARIYCWGETTDQSFRFAHLTTDHKLCTYQKPDWNHFSLSDSNFFKTLVFKHDNKRMNFGKHNLVDTA